MPLDNKKKNFVRQKSNNLHGHSNPWVWPWTFNSKVTSMAIFVIMLLFSALSMKARLVAKLQAKYKYDIIFPVFSYTEQTQRTVRYIINCFVCRCKSKRKTRHVMRNCIDWNPNDWNQKKYEEFVDEVSKKKTTTIILDKEYKLRKTSSLHQRPLPITSTPSPQESHFTSIHSPLNHHVSVKFISVEHYISG